MSKPRRSSSDSQLSIFDVESSNRPRLALVPPPAPVALPAEAPPEIWCGHLVRTEADDAAMIAVGWAVRRLTGADLGSVSVRELLDETGLDPVALRRALRLLRTVRPGGRPVLEVIAGAGLRMQLRVGPAQLEHAIRRARALTAAHGRTK